VRALLTDKSGGPIPDDFAEAAARAMKKKTEKNVFLSLVSMFQLVRALYTEIVYYFFFLFSERKWKLNKYVVGISRTS